MSAFGENLAKDYKSSSSTSNIFENRLKAFRFSKSSPFLTPSSFFNHWQRIDHRTVNQADAKKQIDVFLNSDETEALGYISQELDNRQTVEKSSQTVHHIIGGCVPLARLIQLVGI